MSIRSALATVAQISFVQVSRARVSTGLVSSFLVIGLLGAPNAHAFEITAAQRAACTPDVMRLCASEYPDPSRVIACMRANKSQVSPACVAVIPAKAWSTSTKLAAR